MPARSPVPATFAPPPKGLFTHDSSNSRQQNSTATSAAIPITRKEESVRSSAGGAEEGEDDQAGMLPSSVPSRGRRRESLGAQMRKGLNLGSPASVGAGSLGHAYSYGQSTPTTAAGGPASIGSGSSSATTTLGSRPIGIAGGARTSPTSTFAAGRYASSMSRGGTSSVADLSTSFGTAAEALSMSLGRGGPLSSSLSVGDRSDGVSIPGAAAGARTTSKGQEAAATGQKSLGHSHFGQECFGPSDFDASLPNVPPSKAALAQLQANSEAQANKVANGDADGSEAGYNGNSDQLLHKCESCAKVYRHPSCLIKHRWEHTVYWKEASKFLLSKHQQVQLLEAAAILVGMDCESRSLPEEKALWPAAVSPPESGLLGSEVFNYDKLMEGRRARQGQRATSPSMSPLNSLSQLHLDSGVANGVVVTASSSASATAVKPTAGSSSGRAGSADAAFTVPEEDLMEDVTRSSTTTATRTTSSTGRSSAHDADSPGRSSLGANDEEDEEEEELDQEERDRSPGGSGGDVVGTFEMEE